MRVLNRYIILDYLIIFFTALLLITFVMTCGALVKAVDLMARGISLKLILTFFFQNIPYILSFSVPISTLFAALLLFGRLSMDNEISAMKACGISLLRLVSPLIVLSVLFSALCVYINCNLAPDAKYANKKLLRSSGVDEPINLLEEGRFIDDFSGLMVYVGRKKNNFVEDVVVYQLNKEGGVRRSIRARTGDLEADNTNKVLTVKLYNGRIEEPDQADPHDISKTKYTPFEFVKIPLDFKDMFKEKKMRRKRGSMTLIQLISHIRNMERDYPMIDDDVIEKERSKLVIEANRRISTSVACFTFMLIGIPLGVKSHRKETSIGMVLSLAIVFAYYMFIVIAKALAKYPDLHPSLFLWIPLIMTQIFGAVLIRRSS